MTPPPSTQLGNILTRNDPLQNHRNKLKMENFETKSTTICKISVSFAIFTTKLSREMAENMVLGKLKEQLNRSGSDLKDFNLPEQTNCNVNRAPRIILAETSYDRENLQCEARTQFDRMNPDQAKFFKDVIQSVDAEEGKLFCLNAAGGTGKTFVLNALLDQFRGQGFVALGTASSGVASKLLNGGTTIHSRFKIPINIQPTSTCSFKGSDATGKLVKMTKLIIMDEMTMTHKHVYEAMDRSIREITKNDAPFGSITTVFAGDWRQCLPIVRKGNRGDIVNACLKSSHLWGKVKERKLTRNMRVELCGESKEFSELLMKIGDGALPENKHIGDAMIELPHELFLENSSVNDLVNNVFPDFEKNYRTSSWIKNRAVLCPTNEECSEVNAILLEKLPGTSTIYKSCDSVSQSEAHMYPTEFLNTINLQGIPPHKLELKPGAIIILLRNLNISEGHVNGTRYIIQNLLPLM